MSPRKRSVIDQGGSAARLWSLAFLVVLTCGFLTAEERGGWLRQKVMEKLNRKASTIYGKLPIREISIQHGGRHRRYFVFEPSTRAGGSDAWPVVLLFHGGGGSARQVLSSCGLIETAKKEGFLLVAPDGTGPAEDILHTWNVGFGFGSALENKVDDVGFVKAVIADLAGRFPIDRNRLFATGISNGGILCHFLAADPVIGLAAIAPVVATIGGKRAETDPWITPPKPSHPVSVLAINGLLDEHVPLGGGKQRKSIQEPVFMMSASETIMLWVTANGCTSTPKTWFDAAQQATWYRFAHPDGRIDVVLAVIHNQGHAWPMSTQTRKQADTPSPTFPANDIMWEFFQSHPRVP